MESFIPHLFGINYKSCRKQTPEKIIIFEEIEGKKSCVWQAELFSCKGILGKGENVFYNLKNKIF